MADGLSVRLDELASRGNQLETYARRSIFGAVTALICGAFCYAPSPAENEAFTTAAAVPPDLVQPLIKGGAALTRVPEWLLANGGAIHPALILAIPVAVALWKLLAKLIPMLWIRLLIVWSSPFWLGAVLAIGNPGKTVEVMAAYPGVITSAPGMPKVAKDGTYEHFAKPYVLQPNTLTPVLADQARYVLAQQAYLTGQPAAVARQLRNMTGTWRPADEHTRIRLGILSDYAEAAGHDIGNADGGAGAIPLHLDWWRLAAFAFGVLGFLMIGAAAILTRLGSVRVTRASRFNAEIQAATNAL